MLLYNHDSGIPGVGWSASLAYLASFRSVRDPAHKKRSGPSLKNGSPGCPLGSYMLTHVHEHTQTYTHLTKFSYACEHGWPVSLTQQHSLVEFISVFKVTVNSVGGKRSPRTLAALNKHEHRAFHTLSEGARF